MEVICKGHDVCLNKSWCSHAIPHELDITTINYCHTTGDESTIFRSQPNKMCHCSERYIRKAKLNKLKIL